MSVELCGMLNMVSIIRGCEMDFLFVFANVCIVFLPFQRDEAKCPSLPHSCTCTQDSIGPQGPPGPSVNTALSFLIRLHLLLFCPSALSKLFSSEVEYVLIIRPYSFLLSRAVTHGYKYCYLTFTCYTA